MKQIHLGLFIYPAGHHIAGWRHPSVDIGGITAMAYYTQAAQAAERGLFDLFFVGDALAARERNGRIIAGGALNNMDSVSIVSAISSVTERLGLVATLSTTYNDPVSIARRFASLDHVSAGRAGWNIITTTNDDAAFNFGLDRHMEKGLRYERARDFVALVTTLWDSWPPGERQARLVDYQGAFFQARQHFDTRRPPQGWPVMVQAGGSPPGRDFAARVGEVIFTAVGQLAEAQAYRAAVHALLPLYGRNPANMRIMPGLSPVLADTEQAAQAKLAMLDALVPTEVAVWMLSEQLRFDLFDAPPDAPLPVAAIHAGGEATSPRNAALLERAARDGLSIEASGRIVARSRSHGAFVGTPDQLVTHMEHWVDEGGCDGFNIMPPYFPAELDLFVEQVVPLLQRRGRHRTAYAGTMLRDHLGLARPSQPG